MNKQKCPNGLLVLFLVLLGGMGNCAVWAKEILMPIDLALPTQSEPEAPKPSEPSKPVDPNSIPALKDEISRLRNEITRLQQTLDIFINKTVSDLQAENDRLRQEIRYVYKGQGANLPNVPLPDKQLLEGLISQPHTPSQPNQTSSQEQAVLPEIVRSKPDTAKPKTEVPGGLAYDVISQWGRSPEEAVALSDKDKKTSSLLGMVCVIPPGSQEENLVALARSLRGQCDTYDNINIEVFDDETAAHAFNENKGTNPQHRILSISRHKASNRDVILLFKGDKTVEIPLKP